MWACGCGAEDFGGYAGGLRSSEQRRLRTSHQPMCRSQFSSPQTIPLSSLPVSGQREQNWHLSMQIFSTMMRSSARPDVITFTSTINACEKLQLQSQTDVLVARKTYSVAETR